MKIAQNLRRIVERNCIAKDGDASTLAYWSDVVFAKCVFVLAPLSLIAIIPAMFITITIQSYLILWFDVFCLVMLLFVGYAPGISVKTRKILLISLLFLTAYILLKELGNFGPGLVYLLSVTVISLLLFPGTKTAVPFVLTLLFCVVYGFLIHFGIVKIQAKDANYVTEWIAVSSNVLFMSAVFSLIVPFFFSKLEAIIGEKMQLIESVRKSNLELEHSIEEVNSKNLELEQFAYVASHDLQEPLRMITSFLDLLKRKYKDKLDEKANQYINFATDGAFRMKEVILDLLEYSRAGQFTEVKEKVDLNEIVENYQVLRKKIITDKSAVISAEKLPIIAAHKVPLTQTLHCLLDNAIYYSKSDQKPIVTMSTKDLGKAWEIQITDNGIGIAKEFHDKIFAIFQRLHNKDQDWGNGIGLAIVKKNVESWGGKVRLESTLGEGSSFSFSIPKTELV